jgi:hypothetical protein
MRAGILYLWLALMGNESAVPAAFTDGISVHARVPTMWVGDWLVEGDRRAMSATVTAVPGRVELAAKLTIVDGAAAVVEYWIGRPEGRVLRLTRTGVGTGLFKVSETGGVTGYLTRHDVVGSVELSSQR